MSAELPSTNSVFMVHGHDEGAKYAVARFLEQLGINPVILHEQINRGMTLIEKFEDFANRAGFAVVLMTPNDYGHSIAPESERKLNLDLAKMLSWNWVISQRNSVETRPLFL
jgi:predicted nucleotide-binding protein